MLHMHHAINPLLDQALQLCTHKLTNYNIYWMSMQSAVIFICYCILGVQHTDLRYRIFLVHIHHHNIVNTVMNLMVCPTKQIYAITAWYMNITTKFQ